MASWLLGKHSSTWTTLSALLVYFCFGDKSLLTLPSWPPTLDPPASACRMARNSSLCHHTQ
jgi:hypothetical protein